MKLLEQNLAEVLLKLVSPLFGTVEVQMESDREPTLTNYEFGIHLLFVMGRIVMA